MKTRIATLMMMLGLFIASTAFASEPVPASKAVRQSVAQYVQSELEYPEFAIKEKFECCVLVSLVIQEDGTFEVDCANCVDDDMKEYVIGEIENMQSDKFSLYSGQQVLLKVNFDLLLT
jgi:hypothetical protein